MSAVAAPGLEFRERDDYLQEYTLKSWLLTTDHKRIGDAVPDRRSRSSSSSAASRPR